MSTTFRQLMESHPKGVVIPLLQRDYAQGRPSAKAIRERFIDDLLAALQPSAGPIDLDFVYGTARDAQFLPLDGQQRLTTLFLLHWYLATRDGALGDFRTYAQMGSNARFAYTVRPSARDFFDALIGADIDLDALLPSTSSDGNALSRTIEDQPWFFQSWRLDPTVTSCLAVLDTIHGRCATLRGLYHRLAHSEPPQITFQFLDLKELELTDDLYIKMNARGKPLTAFENFKASFEEHVGTLLPDEERALEGVPVSLKHYLSQRFDTAWCDLFWGLSGLRAEGVSYDALTMNMIRAVAMVSGPRPSSTDEQEAFEDRLDVIRGARTAKRKLKTFYDYQDEGLLSAEFVHSLVSLFDRWAAAESSPPSFITMGERHPAPPSRPAPTPTPPVASSPLPTPHQDLIPVLVALDTAGTGADGADWETIERRVWGAHANHVRKIGRADANPRPACVQASNRAYRRMRADVDSGSRFVDSPRRGRHAITPTGRAWLAQPGNAPAIRRAWQNVGATEALPPRYRKSAAVPNRVEAGRPFSGVSKPQAYYDEVEVFRRVARGETEGRQRITFDDWVQFVAWCDYLLTEQPLDQLAEWMRVVANLARNTIYNRATELRGSLLSLRALLPRVEAGFLQFWASPEAARVKGFSAQQIREERIKAHLLMRHPGWRPLIEQAETHPFFAGQIEFLLDFSGVLNAWAPDEQCGWTDAEDVALRASFERWYARAAAVFSGAATGEPGLRPLPNFLWERALLCEGDYLLRRGPNFSFLEDFGRDGSWKRLLRGDMQDGPVSKRRKILRAVLATVDPEDVEGCLQARIDRGVGAIEGEAHAGWRERLVEFPELIEYCKKREIRWEPNGAVYLLSKQRLSGNHKDLFCAHLELALSPAVARGEFLPFSHIACDGHWGSADHWLRLRGDSEALGEVLVAYWAGSYEIRCRPDLFPEGREQEHPGPAIWVTLGEVEDVLGQIAAKAKSESWV